MKGIMVLVLLAVAASCGCATTASTGSPTTCPQDSHAEAEQVVDQYIAAMTGGDLETCASLMHPDALKGLQEILLPIVDMAKQAGRKEQFFTLFADVDSANALRALSQEAFFVSFLKGSLFSQPEIFEAMKNMQYTIIGTAPEGDGVVHVLYRLKMSMMGTDVEELETISLKQSGDSWRLLLSGDIKNTAEKIKQAFASRF